MLLNSLIFLLLSNSITSRRDKSKLYSRITLTILLISALIAYDNLSLLFLAKGIGIFVGLSIFLSIELQSYELYLLSTVYRDSEPATSGGPMYLLLVGWIAEKSSIVKKVDIKIKDIVISSSLTLSISIITLVITLFIFIPAELLSLANILALLIFNL